MTEPAILAVLHNAELFRDPKWAWAAVKDWEKIRRFLAGTWPLEKPPAWTEGRAEEWFRLAHQHAPWVVIDTEYNPKSHKLYLIGLGYPGAPATLHIRWAGEDVALYGRLLHDLARVKGLVFQNAQADLLSLHRAGLLDYADCVRVDDTLLAHGVLWSEWPHDLDFLSSIYGHHGRSKHLRDVDVILYNQGDVLDTISTWEALLGEFARDPASKTIYEEQSLKLLPIVWEAKLHGLRVNTERVEAAHTDYTARRDVAQRMAWAWCGWPINLASNPQLSWYLYQYRQYPLQLDKDTKRPTIDGDAIATLRQHVGPYYDPDAEERHPLGVDDGLARIARGADPVLEARVIFAASAQIVSHYLAPLLHADRIYANQRPDAQATGRWSTTEPPLAQLPDDLRDIVVPDPGYDLIGFDFDQIELRLQAVEAGDADLLGVFERGEDVHTMNTCDIFGLPRPPTLKDPHKSPACAAWREAVHWEGKDDPRRVFSKRFVYRNNYGGDPAMAGDIPGAKQLGLDGPKLVAASNRYLARHPAIARYWGGIRRQVAAKREIRSFLGRRRRLLGKTAKAIRAAYDHPMQGGCTDVFNLTCIAIKERWPFLIWAWGMHDSQYWLCPKSKTAEVMQELPAIVEREWVINGRTIRFTAAYKAPVEGAVLTRRPQCN